MGRVRIIATQLSLWVLFATLLQLQHGAQGARLLSARVHGELPPCKDVPGGIPGWDSFDPPTTPLPPCDFRHQMAGIDCWPRSPPAATVTTDQSAHHVEGMLPPCKNIPGGIPGRNCFDPPTGDLPPCNFEHQRAGIDRWRRPSPPAASTVPTVRPDPVSATESDSHHVVDAMLLPCKDVPGGIPGWDCYDPPKSSLPPCDFKHQRIGFNCEPPTPPHH